MDNIIIYTRGILVQNGTGKWSAVIRGQDYYKELLGSAVKTDKNRIELIPIANALSRIKENYDIVIFSNSQFIVNAFNRGWVANWKAKGWLRFKGNKVYNIDILDYILTANKKHTISFRWLQDYSSVDSKKAEELISI